MSLDSQAVADYLRDHPEFFEEHAHWLAEVKIAHPHEGHAIPIAERQLVQLREKNRQLESRFAELVRYGGSNDQISERLHRVTLALFAAPEIDTSLEVIYHSMHSDFNVHARRSACGAPCPTMRTRPSSRRSAPRCATTRRASPSRIAAARRARIAELAREEGGMLNSFAYLRCARRNARSASSRSAARSRALHRRHGHAFPDAARRSRQRGDRALPSGRLMVGRSPESPVHLRVRRAPRNPRFRAYARRISARHRAAAALARRVAADSAGADHRRAVAPFPFDAARPRTFGPHAGADALVVARVFPLPAEEGRSGRSLRGLRPPKSAKRLPNALSPTRRRGWSRSRR
jgi:hypothetical protein